MSEFDTISPAESSDTANTTSPATSFFVPTLLAVLAGSAWGYVVYTTTQSFLNASGQTNEVLFFAYALPVLAVALMVIAALGALVFFLTWANTDKQRKTNLAYATGLTAILFFYLAAVAVRSVWATMNSNVPAGAEILSILTGIPFIPAAQFLGMLAITLALVVRYRESRGERRSSGIRKTSLISAIAGAIAGVSWIAVATYLMVWTYENGYQQWPAKAVTIHLGQAVASSATTVALLFIALALLRTDSIRPAARWVIIAGIFPFIQFALAVWQIAIGTTLTTAQKFAFLTWSDAGDCFFLLALGTFALLTSKAVEKRAASNTDGALGDELAESGDLVAVPAGPVGSHAVAEGAAPELRGAAGGATADAAVPPAATSAASGVSDDNVDGENSGMGSA